MGKKKADNAPKYRPLTILLEEAQIDTLNAKSREDERSISWMLRKAVSEYLERNPLKQNKNSSTNAAIPSDSANDA